MYGLAYIGANESWALDAPQDNKCVFAIAEDLSADRQLNFIIGDANRTLDLTPTNDFGLMYDGAAAKWMAKDIVATLSSIFKTDGSRDVTGQITSTFAGAPFVVADSTVVANLNVDLLDGNHASAFATASHAHAFLNLSDVPASYATHGLKVVRVNVGETALEYAAASAAAFTDMTDVPGSYATHGDKTVTVNAGATALEFRGPWLDQDVRVAAAPTFGGLTVDGSVTLTNCSTFNISDAPGNTSFVLDGTMSVGSTCNIVGLFTANNQIVSTLADGGAMPINVTSLVKCAKLNSDMVDDAHVGTSGAAILLLNAENTFSADQLFGGSTKILLDNANQWLYAPSPETVQLNAKAGLFFGIDGNSEILIETDKMTFFQGGPIDEVGFTWGTLKELVVTVATVPKFAFSATGLDVVNQVQAANFVSDVATGTPPLTVASTTLVANLNVASAANADTVDSLHVATSGSALADMSAANTWTGVQTFGTNVKQQFRDSLNYIQSGAPNFLLVNAGTTLFLATVGAARLTLTSTLALFAPPVQGNRFTSIVTTGTSPYACNSETENTHLNANFLQGNLASAFALASHTHSLTDVTDITALAAEVNLLDLAGMTAGDVLSADSATTASWKAQAGSSSPLTVSTTQVFSGTSPTSMTNLDLSGTVGANIALVALSFKSASDMNATAVRTDTDANDYYSQTSDANAYGCQLGHHDADADLVLIVATNSSGIIEWQTESAQTCTVDVLWFIK